MNQRPVVAGGIVLALLLAAGIVPRIRSHASLQEDQADAKPTVVITHPRLVADVGVTLPATMQGVDTTILSARQTGYLERYTVDIGSHVHRGQLMAVLTAPDADQQFRQSRAQEAQAVAGVAQSRSDEVRLTAATSGARSQWAQARAQLSHSIAAEAQSRANVSAAQRQLAQAEAEADKSQHAEDLAYRNWKRDEQLYKSGLDTVQNADQLQVAWKEASADRVASQRGVDAADAQLKAQEAALDSARADVVAARANVDTARQNVSAAQAAQTTGISSIDAAVANEQATSANMQRNQTLKDFERVVAPFDGVVTNRYADAGTLITADGSNKAYLFGMARADVLRVQLHVPESYATGLEVGQPAEMTVRELPGQKFKGTVTKIAQSLDPTTRTELVEVWTRNTKGTMMPGMYANIELHPAVAPTLRVPGTALVADSRGTGVLVVDADHTVHYRSITPGRDFGTETEVTQGLTEKDVIVDTPPDTLQDGRSVETIDEPEPEGGKKDVPTHN